MGCVPPRTGCQPRAAHGWGISEPPTPPRPSWFGFGTRERRQHRDRTAGGGWWRGGDEGNVPWGGSAAGQGQTQAMHGEAAGLVLLLSCSWSIPPRCRCCPCTPRALLVAQGSPRATCSTQTRPRSAPKQLRFAASPPGWAFLLHFLLYSCENSIRFLLKVSNKSSHG